MFSIMRLSRSSSSVRVGVVQYILYSSLRQYTRFAVEAMKMKAKSINIGDGRSVMFKEKSSETRYANQMSERKVASRRIASDGVMLCIVEFWFCAWYGCLSSRVCSYGR